MKNSKNQFKVNEQALINDILTNGKQERTWHDLAIQHGIVPNSSKRENQALTKAANDVWRRWSKINRSIVEPIIVASTPQNFQMASQAITTSVGHMGGYAFPHNLDPGHTPTTPLVWKPKRLFYDIETSYNIVKAWRVGYNLSLQPEDIIQERAIITIAYKWEGEDDVVVLTWNKGDDKKIIEEFVKVMAEADELVGHNVDRFDTKFVMGRALKHGISVLPKYQSTDTLKLARKHFMLNSNKLDYIAQYLGLGHKVRHRGMSMWDDIIQRNCPKAMDEMVEYNIQDVILTEKVFNKLTEYSLPKVNHASKQTGDKHTCPQCGSTDATLQKTYVASSGTKTRLMSCNSCSTNFTINNTNYEKHYNGVNAG